MKGELDAISQMNQTVVNEMMVLKKMNTQSEAVPVIKIRGKVQSGTKLCGHHSQLTVPKSISHVHVKEIQSTDKNNKRVWSMVLAPG